MATTIQGARRTDAYRFEGEEIQQLAVSRQLVRWEGEGLDAEHVEYLAQSIAELGQQAPVLIRKRADGKPELVAGRHRRAAVLKINADPSAYGLPGPVALTAVYKDLSDEQSIRASFEENTNKPLTCMDLAYTAVQLSNLDWPNDRIASVLTAPHHKVGVSRVSQLRALIRLPHRVQLMLHKGLIPESAARAMLKMGLDSEAMEALAADLEAGRVRAAELTSEVNAQRRADGKRVKRTLNDLRKKLMELGTVKATDLLGWIDGEVVGDEVVERMMADEGESGEIE